ncbi:hypothetical protein HII31_11338 [Pseudocercospora fuligena]|uniref:Glycoside hydrolase family 24 protein n=1 Tax=Pseudocercospora fuligena TaxID=685502 RepID=A0A8H6VHS2_9PEZI|nr:hypothetical protein HII31_11338 [Pseudocercospora fuligena]
MANTTLQPLQQCVAEYINVNVKVNDYQYGTLVSAAYYLGGCDSFKKSSVCQKINGLSSKSTYNDVSNICQTELPKWYSASGKGSNNKRCASQISLSKNSGGKSCLPCKNDPKGSNSLSKGGNDKGTQWNNNTPNKAYEKNTLGGSGNVKPSGSGKNDPKNDGMKDGKNDDRKTGGNDGKNGEKNSWGNDNDKNDNNKNGSKTGGEKSGWGDDDDNKNDQKNNSQKKDEGKKGDQNKDDGHKNDQNTGKSGQKGGW